MKYYHDTDELFPVYSFSLEKKRNGVDYAIEFDDADITEYDKAVCTVYRFGNKFEDIIIKHWADQKKI